MLIPTDIPGCRLRPWQGGDVDSLVRHADNRKVWRNLRHTFPHPYTAADAQAWIRLAGLPGASVHLAIEVDGDAVGGIGAIAGVGIGERTADFGYWLGEPVWGRGIATAAARAFLARLMADARFARLEAPVFAWNPASMRVLEKVGFRREGILRRSVSKDGQLIDSVLYAYTPD